MIEVPYGRVPYPLDIGPHAALVEEALRCLPRENITLARVTGPVPLGPAMAGAPSDAPRVRDGLAWIRPCARSSRTITFDVTSVTAPRYQAPHDAAIAPHNSDEATHIFAGQLSSCKLTGLAGQLSSCKLTGLAGQLSSAELTGLAAQLSSAELAGLAAQLSADELTGLAGQLFDEVAG